MMAAIVVRDLVKDYVVDKKKNGMKGALAGLFVHKKETIRAVDGISFSIQKGEVVGFIGPNGSGKSTTIKMMSGILRPSAGDISVHGMDPQKNRRQVVQDLGVVFGQRSQLFWDLRLGESFELMKRIYRIQDSVYRENLDLLDELLKIGEIIDKPVRQMSLGQRMRGDLAAAVLHSPSILYLDEPTIGLDIDAKQAVRQFIRDINQARKTTVILTTHDLDDIQELCSRVMVINRGRIVEDGSLDGLVGKISPTRRLVVDLYEENRDISHPMAKVIQNKGARVWFEFNKQEMSAAQLISDLSKQVDIRDLSLEEPDIEDIIRTIYHNESDSDRAVSNPNG